MLAPASEVVGPERWQRQVKAELLGDAVAAIGIDAMTFGSEDLAFGRDFFLARARSLKLPYLAANLADAQTGAPIFPGTLLRDLNGGRVGIFGLIPQDLQIEGWTVKPALEAAREAVASLRSQGATRIIALSNQRFEVNEALAKELPELDIVVLGSSRRKLDVPRIEGSAALLEAGNRGKFLGIFEATLVGEIRGWQDVDGEKRDTARIERLRQRLGLLQDRVKASQDEREQGRLEKQIAFYEKELANASASTAPARAGSRNLFVNRQEPLDQKVPDDPAIRGLIDKALERISAGPPPGEDSTAATGAVNLSDPSATDAHNHGSGENHGTALTEGHPASAGPGGDFVGSESCQGCHPGQYAQWKGTPHARAYDTLQKLNRHKDYQCYGCHVTGHNQPGGPQRPEQVGTLAHVGCESCHQAGRAHVANPNGVKPPAVTPEAVCLSCHTPEQTQGRFIYDQYLPRVMHSGPASGKAGAPPAH